MKASRNYISTIMVTCEFNKIKKKGFLILKNSNLLKASFPKFNFCIFCVFFVFMHNVLNLENK